MQKFKFTGWALSLICFIILLASCSQKSTEPLTSPINYRVTDLKVSIVGVNKVRLRWHAPGGEGSEGQAAEYDIRYIEPFLTEERWPAATRVESVPAPKVSGSEEELIITDPQWQQGQQLYFGLKVSSGSGGWGDLSNVAGISEFEYDTRPPAAIQPLQVADISSTSVSLMWPSTGDDGYVGLATRFDLRYSKSSINLENFSSATEVTGLASPLPVGEYQGYTITDLEVGTTYYFAIRAIDNVGNISNLSSQETSATTSASLGISWTGTIESTRKSEAWKIIPSHGDGFIVGGMIHDSLYDLPQSYVAEISSTNQVLWSYAKYLYAPDSLSDIVASRDGSYYLIGTTISPAPYESKPFLIRLDQSGAVIGDKLFDRLYRSFDQLLETPGRTLFALGTYYDGNYTDQWSVLIHLSFNSDQVHGNFYLENVCPDAHDPLAEADGLILSGDSTGMLVAWSATYWPDWSEGAGCGPEVEACLLSRITSSQELVWQKTYGTSGSRFGQLLALNSEHYAALIWDIGGQRLLVIDDNGVVTGESQLSSTAGEGYYDLALTASGNIILVGKIGGENKILVTSPDGTELKLINLPGEQNQKLFSVAVSSSGEVMAVGWREDAFGDRDILLVRISTEY